MHPVCGQCSRAGKAADCEYTDAQGRSRTIILEEKVAVLEARIRELGDLEPMSSESPVLLHDPFQSVPPSPASSIHSRDSYNSGSAMEDDPLSHEVLPSGARRTSGESRSSWEALVGMPVLHPEDSNTGVLESEVPYEGSAI